MFWRPTVEKFARFAFFSSDRVCRVRRRPRAAKPGRQSSRAPGVEAMRIRPMARFGKQTARWLAAVALAAGIAHGLAGHALACNGGGGGGGGSGGGGGGGAAAMAGRGGAGVSAGQAMGMMQM